MFKFQGSGFFASPKVHENELEITKQKISLTVFLRDYSLYILLKLY